MARTGTAHRCRECGAPARRWTGRCPGCGEWNSLEPWQPTAGPAGPGGDRHDGSGPVPLAGVDRQGCRPRPTGLGEVDRVLAGGLLPGSVTLLYGEPGVGKSTLLLQVLARLATTGATVLLVSAEESASQVRHRAERVGEVPPGLMVLATADLGRVEAAVTALAPALVVVDSVHTVADPGSGQPPGSVAAVRSCVDRLARLAKEGGTTMVLVGQVTKEGGPAGPRTLEHLVDTVVAFEGDRHHALRTLRAVKHRFGPTGEVGLFEMGSAGLLDVADPGPLLLGDRRPEVPGSAVVPVLEGRRPLLVEIQALACTGAPGSARRHVQGLDLRRLAAVVAVLESRAGVDVGPLELFASATGGIQVGEPAADLPLALAVASAVAGVPLPADLVSFGEVGLAGEIRQVGGAPRRLAEAARLGFTRALVPTTTPSPPGSPALVRVGTVVEAVAAALRLREADLAGATAEPAGGSGPVPDRPALPPGTMPSWSTTARSR